MKPSCSEKIGESSQTGESGKPRQIPVDWADSHWFRVWLQLARREYSPAETDDRAVKEAA